LSLVITVETHPLLRVGAFVTEFPAPLSESASPDWLVALLKHGADAPFHSDDALRAAVRDLLRHGGYKPTGRGKPASEYLIRAASDGSLGSINLAVDACNVTSLHSGLPISVVDLELAHEPFRVAIAREGEKYIFNSANQEIDLAGLLCLYDEEGPCANAVKDSQRTKTRGETRHALSIIWGCAGYEARLEDAVGWYRDLLTRAGASTTLVEIRDA
jgi:DNA/RNA-binding domain of Phe-tRNA-synthetase-like protein